MGGPIREFTVALGAYSRGGLLTICSSTVGANSRGGGQFEDLRYCTIMKQWNRKFHRQIAHPVLASLGTFLAVIPSITHFQPARQF